jgi:hypothetical protein
MVNYSTGTSYNMFLQMASKTLLPMRISHKVIYFLQDVSLFANKNGTKNTSGIW